MLAKIFESIAARAFGALLLLSLVLHVVTGIGHRREVAKLNSTVAAYKRATDDYKVAVATLRGNQAALTAGLRVCNANVENLANVRNALTSAGVKALQEVQKAGRSVDRKVREIDAMPTATCEDAFKILKSN